MSGRMFSRCLMFLAIAAMAIPMCAAVSSMHKSINLTNKTDLNGTMLQPGSYTLVVNGNQAKFEQKGKVMANVPCTWRTMKNKSQYDALLYTQNKLTGIQFQGSNRAIAFGQTSANAQP
jgi:hypothetical protein